MAEVHSEQNGVCVLTYNILRKQHRPALLAGFITSVPTEVDFVALQEVCTADLEVVREILRSSTISSSRVATSSSSAGFEIVTTSSQQTGFNIVLVNTSRWEILSRQSCPCMLPHSSSCNTISEEVSQDPDVASDTCGSPKLSTKTFDVAFTLVARRECHRRDLVCVASFHTPGGQIEKKPGDEAMGKTRKSQNVTILSTIVDHAVKVCLGLSDKHLARATGASSSFNVSCIAVGDGNFQQIGKGMFSQLKTEFTTALGVANASNGGGGFLNVMTTFKSSTSGDLAEYGGFVLDVRIDPESSHRVKHEVLRPLPAAWSYADGIRLVNSDHEPAFLRVCAVSPAAAAAAAQANPFIEKIAAHETKTGTKTGTTHKAPSEPGTTQSNPPPLARPSSATKPSPERVPMTTPPPSVVVAVEEDEAARGAFIAELQILLNVKSDKELAERLGYSASSSITTFKKTGSGRIIARAKEEIEKDKIIVTAASFPFLHAFIHSTKGASPPSKAKQ